MNDIHGLVEDVCREASLSPPARGFLHASAAATARDDADAWDVLAAALAAAPLADDDPLALVLPARIGARVHAGAFIGLPTLRTYLPYLGAARVPFHLPLRLCGAAGALEDGELLIAYAGTRQRPAVPAASFELVDVWLWRVRAVLPLLAEAAEDADRALLRRLRSPAAATEAILESIAGHERGHVMTLRVTGDAESDLAADAAGVGITSDAAVWMTGAYHVWNFVRMRQLAGPDWRTAFRTDADWLGSTLVVAALAARPRWTAASIREAVHQALGAVPDAAPAIPDGILRAADAVRPAGAYRSTLSTPDALRRLAVAVEASCPR